MARPRRGHAGPRRPRSRAPSSDPANVTVIREMMNVGSYATIAVIILTLLRWLWWFIASAVDFLWPATLLSWAWGAVAAVLFDQGDREPLRPSWVTVAVLGGVMFGLSSLTSGRAPPRPVSPSQSPRR
eukprot:m.210473 g.210473  ORF g.210473 m.210473 type:complete len:128 (+) comp25069_c0_seq1:66-449(+)